MKIKDPNALAFYVGMTILITIFMCNIVGQYTSHTQENVRYVDTIYVQNKNDLSKIYLDSINVLRQKLIEANKINNSLSAHKYLGFVKMIKSFQPLATDFQIDLTKDKYYRIYDIQISKPHKSFVITLLGANSNGFVWAYGIQITDKQLFDNFEIIKYE